MLFCANWVLNTILQKYSMQTTNAKQKYINSIDCLRWNKMKNSFIHHVHSGRSSVFSILLWEHKCNQFASLNRSLSYKGATGTWKNCPGHSSFCPFISVALKANTHTLAHQETHNNKHASKYTHTHIQTSKINWKQIPVSIKITLEQY